MIDTKIYTNTITLVNYLAYVTVKLLITDYLTCMLIIKEEIFNLQRKLNTAALFGEKKAQSRPVNN